MSDVEQALPYGGASQRLAMNRNAARSIVAEWSRRVIVTLAVLSLVVFIVIPIVMLFYGSVRDASPGQPGAFTLGNYAFLGTSDFARLVANSAVVGVGSTLLAMAIGLALAFLMVRVRVPFAAQFDALIVVPGYLTPVVGAIAWIVLLSPGRGWINNLLNALGLPTLDIYGFGGIIWVMGLYFAPLAYLYVRPMLEGIDRSLEESARVLGASPRITFRRIILPLAMPALLSATLVIFVNAVGDFGIPGALGYRDKIDVIPTALVRLVVIFPSDPNRATVLGIALMVITIACLAISRRLLSGRSFTTVGVRGGRGLPSGRGAASWAALAVILLYILIALVLPVLAMGVTSFQKFPNPNLFSATYTLDNYRFVLTFPAIGRSIVNSAMLALGAAVICTVLATIVGYMVVKARSAASVTLDFIGSSTLAIPHTVFGLGTLWFWVSVPAGIYGTRWILLFAYVAFFFPYALRAAINAFLQVDRSMEEAGRVFGASWQKTILAIIVPIIAPGLLSGATIIIYHTFRELSGSLLLYSPGGEVMATALWGLYTEGRFVELFALAMLNIVIVLGLVALATWLARRTQHRARP